MYTIRLGIYETNNYSLLIEYELIGDAIAITNVDIQARPVSEFERRKQSRRNSTYKIRPVSPSRDLLTEFDEDYLSKKP